MAFLFYSQALLLIFVGGVGTFGFALSLWLNGYTFASVIEQRAVDEVILRTSTYPVLALVLGFIALLIVLWQRIMYRMNALQADAGIEAERRRIAMDIHDSVLSRLTLFGAAYIAAVCLLPQFLVVVWNVPFYLGGTSLLIVVVVVMDFMAQVQSHLMSHQYDSLLKKSNLKSFGRR